jgi:hypothetical protein
MTSISSGRSSRAPRLGISLLLRAWCEFTAGALLNGALVVLLTALFAAVCSANAHAAPGEVSSPQPKLSVAAGAPVLRRFAIIASANDGGPGRARLRYADTDARAMAEVLQSLGGLAPSDLVLIPAATRSSFLAAFDRVKGSVQSAGRVRRELFVYYSGHSDEEGLLLGNQRIGYRELREHLADAGADVRIAILDSCASGALISLKGGKRRPAFLDDVSTNARGHAFLTASTDTEAAQESERIGAAFFTHYLVSGLRGAADTTRDGRVTLNEAYQYAYHETLRRTERTSAGPQHPAYDIQLAGTGDFVVTDLRATSASLVIDERVVGRIYVRDLTGRLLVELAKQPAYPVELGLGPGDYKVALDVDGRPYEAQVRLTEGGRTQLGPSAFVAVATTMTLARGDLPATGVDPNTGTPTVAASAGPPRGVYRHVPFDLVLVPGVRLVGPANVPTVNNFVVGLVSHTQVLHGFQLSLAGNMVDDEMRGFQLAPGFNLSRGSTRGVQIASFANITLGEQRGLQLAGFTNIALSEVRGLQISQLNWANANVRGGQIGIFNHIGGDGRAPQIGVANITRRQLRGAQIGVGNAAGEIRGPQVGVLNVTGAVRGAQIGVLNIGGSAEGTQIGVVNIGRKMRGLQLGVLNIAESVDGGSVGLLSIVGDGYHAATVWSGDVLPLNVGFKLGSRHVYTLFGFGTGQIENTGVDTTNKALYGFSAGFGVHANLGHPRLFLDVDAVSTGFMTSGDWDGDNQVMSTLRAQVGFRIFRHLAITAGPTYNVYVRKADGPDYKPGWGVL